MCSKADDEGESSNFLELKVFLIRFHVCTNLKEKHEYDRANRTAADTEIGIGNPVILLVRKLVFEAGVQISDPTSCCQFEELQSSDNRLEFGKPMLYSLCCF